MHETSAQVAIIGAGPIGIELAVALKKAGVDCLHFDAGQIGHTIAWFAPDTRFFSSNERIAIAGVPLFTADQSKATREQYLAYLRGVVTQFDLPIRTFERVTHILPRERKIILQTSRGHYRADKLVLVTGGTERPRMLGIPGENLPHVSHYFQDPHTYFRKKLLIIGGKNSAVEAALRCHNAGAKVCISYRRDQIDSDRIKYWLWPEFSGLMQSQQITCQMESEPVEILPDKVRLKTASGIVEVDADFVLLLIGYEADMSLFRLAGVTLSASGQVPTFNESTMETNVPGVYVAGTATGGTQDRYSVFIENCHVHVDRIVASITDKPLVSKPEPSAYDRPES